MRFELVICDSIILFIVYFNHFVQLYWCVASMSAYSAHLTMLFILSWHCLRRCVPRLQREHVFSAQEGNSASTYLTVSPLSQGCGPSVGTKNCTLIFGFHPVSANWTTTRDLTSRELITARDLFGNHLAWFLSRLTIQGAPNTPWTISATSR